jgi:Flp pilus assembly protein TadD
MFRRRFDEAKRAYKRVLEIHPLHPTGLAFLGMTCHLRDELDDAILHYHEVRLPWSCATVCPTE